MSKFTIAITVLILIISCGFNGELKQNDQRVLSEEFKRYWFNNGAELNVYELKQVRYGEVRKGKAVLVFVSESFNPDKLVKSDEYKKENIPVLKLNYIKKFVTGVYDYSMMTSDFFPLYSGNHALKISSSSQEWCGHTFMQLENKNDFQVRLHSYFETEGEQFFKLKKQHLEDDLMNQIRIGTELLPQGEVLMIPGFFYLRLKHQEFGSKKAFTVLKEDTDSTMIYQVNYPDLKREIQIKFIKKFPRTILSWKESYPESWTDNTNIMSTEAVLTNQMRLLYWEKNGLADSIYRKELSLPE